MDVVGGLVVAAHSGKRQAAAARGIKRHRAEAVVVSSSRADEWVEQPWSRRVSPRRDGNRDCGGYGLRNVHGGGQTRIGVGGEGTGVGGEGTSVGRLVKAPPSLQDFGDHHHHHHAFGNRRSLLAPIYRPPTLAVRSWVNPLHLFLRKELTVTDVGELGRIILPKRDAELHLPHLDNKEGMLLKMEDYNSNKIWTLRYKWWPNNKSRMYVLESTGEFVKYYNLQEKDELLLHRDTTGAVVIQGQKWSPSNSLLVTDTFPSFKGKSTGKRSPRGPISRFIASAAASSIPTSNAAAPSNVASPDAYAFKAHASMYMDSASAVEPTADCHLQLGLTTPSPHSAQLVNKVVPPLDSGHLSGDSILSTSVLTTSVVSLEQIEIGAPLDGCIDWEKLPDPPAIEFSEDFEGSWPGDCTMID